MKGVYLTILTFVILTSCFAQVTFGLKTGANRADIKIDAPVDKKAIWGFYLGVVHQQKLPGKLIFQTELLYSQKGFSAPSVTFADEQRIILNYINVPVLLGYQFDKRITFLIGPEFGLLTKAKSKFESTESDQTRMYKKFDVGLDLSLNITPVKKIGLDLRYNYGLTSLGGIPLRDRNNNSSFAKTSNQVLQFGISYLFVK